MTKNIKDLPKDIYSLFEKPVKVKEEHLDAFLRDIKEGILKQMEGDRERPFTLRMSNVGWHPRRLYYDAKSGGKGEILHGSHYVKFIFGDMIEALLIFLARTAGHTVTDEQKEVELEGIKGHIDGKFDGVLTDAKSASPYGFTKFTGGPIREADGGFNRVYLHQLGGYMEAMEEDQAAFVAVNKVSGHIAVNLMDEMDFPLVSDQIKKVKVVLDNDELPPRCFSDVPDGKSGNTKLCSECVYCPHKHECWSDANEGRGLRMFRYSNEIRYLTNVEKTPKVVEISSDFENES
jgi:hypothetical protein